jgi:hypothetical protein
MGHMHQAFAAVYPTREAQAAQADKAANFPRHFDNRGEVSAVLHDTPVRVSYEMTILGPEVDQVCINGAVIPGAYFDADTRRDWERDIQRSRDDAGFVQ